MPTVRKSVIVAHSCAEMFDLVDDVERYPQFLPWCSGTEVFERREEITRARLDIDYHGLKTSISTLNRKEAPKQMTLEFVEGPFERFKGHWRFVPLGEEGCRVEFTLDYAFSNAALETLLGPVFGPIIESLVDRFVERAEAKPARKAPQMTLRVTVAIALPGHQEVIAVELPEGSRVADALECARKGGRFPQVDFGQARVGIWSRPCERDTVLREGDRVEIYRPLQADPKDMRRARARLKPSTRSRNGP